jgi:hypothetical protein
MTTDDLMQQIAETERLIAVYRNANEVIVGTQDEIYSRRGLINRTTLSAAEIGDQIVRILQRRVEAMRAELQKLGVEYQGESRWSCQPVKDAPHDSSTCPDILGGVIDFDPEITSFLSPRDTWLED